MNTHDLAPSLTRLLSELIDGADSSGAAFVLNSGDIGLLRSLESLSAAQASRSVNDGATVAAHAQHLRYGLSLMNRWTTNGGDPFADARWDEAWRTSDVDDPRWGEIRQALGDEAHRWLEVLATPREVSEVEQTGMVASVVHLAYHLGAIRQIAQASRGPREGTFPARDSESAPSPTLPADAGAPRPQAARTRLAPPTPELPVADVEAAQRYYRDALGFTIGWLSQDGEIGAVSRDGIAVFLRRRTGPFEPAVHWIFAAALDETYDELQSCGARITEPLEAKPWGLRQFTVEDLDGNRFYVHCD